MSVDDPEGDAATAELLETPALQLGANGGTYGIVFHFDYWDTKGLNRSHRLIESVERDILAYAYREKRPFHSEPLELPEDLKTAVVEFPAKTLYVAEGETRALITDPATLDSNGSRTRSFNVCAFRTVFDNGLDGKGHDEFFDAVLHLGFVPQVDAATNPLPDSVLNEYDVIKLLKLWEGGEGVSDSDPHAMRNQLKIWVGPAGSEIPTIGEKPAATGENATTTNRVRMSIGTLAIRILDLANVRHKEPDEAGADGRTTLARARKKLLSRVRTADRVTDAHLAAEDPRPRAGTIQLQIGRELWLPLYDRLSRLRSKEEKSDVSFSLEALVEDFSEGYPDERQSERALEAEGLWDRLLSLQGILCGLLNVDLADDAEMRDTFLLPMNLAADAMLVVNKGTMLMVSDDCRLGRALGPTLGVNPFLTLPHAVLIYNEVQLERALSNAKVAAARSTDETHLQRAQVDMRRALLQRSLPNVFHYSRERTLFDHGVESRRFRELGNSASQRLEGIEGQLAEVRENKRRILQLFAELFIVILTVLQVIGNYEQLYHLAVEHPTGFWLIAVALVTIAGVIYATANQRGAPLTPRNRLAVIAITAVVFWIALYFWLMLFVSDEGEFDKKKQPGEQSTAPPVVQNEVGAAQ